MMQTFSENYFIRANKFRPFQNCSIRHVVSLHIYDLGIFAHFIRRIEPKACKYTVNLVYHDTYYAFICSG